MQRFLQDEDKSNKLNISIKDAYTLLERGEISKAIDSLNSIDYQLDEDDTCRRCEILYGMSKCYFEMGKFERVLRCSEIGLSLESKDIVRIRFLEIMAFTHYRLTNYLEALKYINKTFYTSNYLKYISDDTLKTREIILRKIHYLGI